MFVGRGRYRPRSYLFSWVGTALAGRLENSKCAAQTENAGDYISALLEWQWHTGG
jgi:hypothetical protein